VQKKESLAASSRYGITVELRHIDISPMVFLIILSSDPLLESILGRLEPRYHRRPLADLDVPKSVERLQDLDTDGGKLQLYVTHQALVTRSSSAR
jgi:hypothetical protein